MAKVLVCVENDDVNEKDYLYYASIRSSFSKRGHELRLAKCTQIWNYLTEEPIEVILMFVRGKQSCCWDIARRVKDEWHLAYASPAIKMIIELSLDDFDDPSFDRQTYLSDPEYAKLFDSQVPAYFEMKPEYNRLYDNFSRTFNCEHRVIIGRVESLLFWRRFDRQKFEYKITNLFPGPRERWSWTVSRFSYHPIINLHNYTPETEQVSTVVWSWENKIWVLNTWDKFLQFIKDEQLQLGEERDREDILAVFSHFHRRNIVHKVYQLDSTPKWKRVLLSKYAEMVRPPTHSQMGEKHQVKFWAIDNNSPGGNLEEWILTKQRAEFDAQSWVREEAFKARVQTEINKIYFNCYGIPPDFSLP
ncbi:MAG: hypothetical protein HS114_22715 [Anaerolineales bacterium]|nr:hypothetical protein [Anaerolineales bacterium]